MNRDDEFNLDLWAIERDAKALRSEMVRESVRAFGRWLRAHAHFGRSAKHA